MQELKGLGVALVTPFTTSGNVDFKSLEKIINYQIQGGVNYLVVQGTTGESPVLSQKEKQSVLDFTLEIAKQRVPIVFGLGGNNTAQIIEGLSSYNLKGVQAILSVSPYYSKPTQEGIYQHYKTIAQNSKWPIILYNVPGRTGSNVLPSTVLRIAQDMPQIVAVKEAAGQIEQYMTLLSQRKPNFLILSGDDNLVMPAMAMGADGVISVIGNALPAQFSQMVKACQQGNFEEARSIHFKLLPLINDLFVEGNPGGIKCVLNHLGLCENVLRLPLWPVSAQLSERLYKHLSALGVTLPQ